jgi:mono/diheme cytochrome c family protein
MRLPQSRLFLGIILFLLAMGVASAWMISAPRSRLTRADIAFLEQPGDPEKGALVFTAADCASCHASPGQPDRMRLGGGLALASPFGTFHVPNISPDRRDGIGNWRPEDLANAVMSGISPSGQHYYPALPYTSYAGMTLEDVRNLMAFLRTLPSVSGRPMAHELEFPFNIRRLVGFWKLLFFHRPRPALSFTPGDALNRGRYLAEVLGHCAECHSARNFFGAIERSTRFAGGPDPEGVGFAPNITPSAVGDWSTEEIVEALTNRRTPALRVIGSSMADVVANTAELPRGDLEAIALYLKSLPPRPTPSP